MSPGWELRALELRVGHSYLTATVAHHPHVLVLEHQHQPKTEKIYKYISITRRNHLMTRDQINL